MADVVCSILTANTGLSGTVYWTEMGYRTKKPALSGKLHTLFLLTGLSSGQKLLLDMRHWQKYTVTHFQFLCSSNKCALITPDYWKWYSLNTICLFTLWSIPLCLQAEAQPSVLKSKTKKNNTTLGLLLRLRN